MSSNYYGSSINNDQLFPGEESLGLSFCDKAKEGSKKMKIFCGRCLWTNPKYNNRIFWNFIALYCCERRLPFENLSRSIASSGSNLNQKYLESNCISWHFPILAVLFLTSNKIVLLQSYTFRSLAYWL